MTAEPPTLDAENALPQIRGYRILRLIGHGGMSTVYLAEQESLGRKVAVKVMLPEALSDEVSRRRFENEARTIARLDHPHIVGIFEVGRTIDGLPYYAMPYLARGHLGARIARSEHGLEQGRILAILRALLGALDYAHVRGVVHRDVKAENVLFDEAERPLLADFGIALRKGNSPRVTLAGLAVGSTAYMPPEQARGEEVDSRADLYSVGVLAWEMLTGKLPFVAGDALSMAVMHAQDPIPRLPAELNHWQRFIDRAMSKLPGNRFRSAHQMLEALDRLERGGFSGDALIGNGAAIFRRARALPKGAWIALVLVAAAAIGFALQQRPGTGPREFFRADTSPEPVAELPAPAADPIDTMLRPPPESPAQRWLTDLDRQLRQRKLTSPAGDNAYDSILAAWKADPENERVGTGIGAVVAALGQETYKRLEAGEDKRAREYLKRVETLAAETAPAGAESLAEFRRGAAKALQARVAKAEQRLSRSDAMAAAALASDFTADKALARTLRTRAEKIAQPGERVAGDRADAVIVQGRDGVFAAMRREVTRTEYARFAAAVNRPPSLCREKVSLLRVLAPRDWRTPGFAQDDGQSVVCVSWADADAYARWYSKASGHKYRLPTAAESQVITSQGAGRAVAEWTADCAPGGCRQRVATGTSWRPRLPKSRALDPTRGYDDVGFRLVREM